MRHAKWYNLFIIMNKISKAFILFFAISLLFLGNSASAITDLRDTNLDLSSISCDSAKSQYGSQYNYIITDYDIDIQVNENNTYKVTEKYNVCFAKQGSHGIYRRIPKKISGWREDGSKYKTVAIIKDVEVPGDKYQKDNNFDEVKLTIGDPDVIVENNRHYTISYTYDFGQDKLEGADEFYFNLIGANWDEDVIFTNADYTIRMPKRFDYDQNSLGFSSGPIDRSRKANVDYEVIGNYKIVGSSNETYPGGEALTIRVVLPDGYYVGARKESYPFAIAAVIIATIACVVSYILFLIFGRDSKIVSEVRYDPPKELNPLEFGLLNSTINQSNAVVAMLFYLAEEGYLKIDSDTNGKHFTISKVKNYEGKDKSASTFLEYLFSHSKDGINVTDKDLKDKFYSDIPKIIKASRYNQIHKDCYDRTSVTICTIAAVVSSFVAIAVFILGVIQIEYLPTGKAVLLFLLALALATLAVIISCFIRKRTDYGDKLLAKVRSYADTVKSTNILSSQGASYFYYNYAFAYAIGYATQFSKKFKDVISEPPSWYSGSNFNSITGFTKSMNNVGSTTSYSPSGSGGGGGSSGGGGGGGGGGGW